MSIIFSLTTIQGIIRFLLLQINKKILHFTYPYEKFTFKRMPFQLCNVSDTFQQCMMAIFSDMVEHSIEVFMDDFSVVGTSFDDCLKNLELVFERCEETNLVLNLLFASNMVISNWIFSHPYVNHQPI